MQRIIHFVHVLLVCVLRQSFLSILRLQRCFSYGSSMYINLISFIIVQLEDEDRLYLLAVDDDEEDQCIRLLSFCKKHRQPSNERSAGDERIGQVARQCADYTPPSNPSGCARTGMCHMQYCSYIACVPHSFSMNWLPGCFSDTFFAVKRMLLHHSSIKS